MADNNTKALEELKRLGISPEEVAALAEASCVVAARMAEVMRTLAEVMRPIAESLGPVALAAERRANAMTASRKSTEQWRQAHSIVRQMSVDLGLVVGAFETPGHTLLDLGSVARAISDGHP